MPHFTPAPGVVAEPDPVTFALGGDTFTCIPSIPAARVEALIEGMHGARRGLAVIVDFIEDVVVPSERARLAETLLDTTRPVTNETLVDLFLWLCDTYTQRAQAPVTAPKRANTIDKIERWGELG